MKKSNMDNAIEILVSSGFSPNGYTMQETFKIITSRSYPLAGALVKLGGRPRFTHECGLKATVGERTVCLYDVKNKIAGNFHNFKTSELSADDVKSVVDNYQ